MAVASVFMSDLHAMRAEACEPPAERGKAGTAACAGRQQFFWCAADRRFIRQQRVFMVLNNFCWAIQRPGSDQAYMDLCGGDSALMARPAK